MQDVPQSPSDFVTRLIANQGPLYGYIVSQLGGLEHANDILQETNLKLCRKAELYDTEQPFLRWAYAFARNEVLSWRSRQARSRLVFGEDLVNRIGAIYEGMEQDSERQLAALESCVERLPERQRQLIKARYSRGESVQAIASSLGMQENATAALFYRVRKALATCVELTLGKEVSP